MIRRLLSALCLILLSVLMLSSCAEADPTAQDGVMTEVKDASGQISGYECRYHNDNGDITRLDVYDAEKVYQSFVIYEYDSKNRLIQESTYSADGLGDFYYTYDYDDDGNLIEKGWYSAKNGASITLYDADGGEYEKYVYDRNDTLTNHYVMQDGQWVEAPIDEEETEDEAEIIE